MTGRPVSLQRGRAPTPTELAELRNAIISMSVDEWVACCAHLIDVGKLCEYGNLGSVQAILHATTLAKRTKYGPSRKQRSALRRLAHAGMSVLQLVDGSMVPIPFSWVTGGLL